MPPRKIGSTKGAKAQAQATKRKERQTSKSDKPPKSKSTVKAKPRQASASEPPQTKPKSTKGGSGRATSARPNSARATSAKDTAPPRQYDLIDNSDDDQLIQPATLTSVPNQSFMRTLEQIGGNARNFRIEQRQTNSTQKFTLQPGALTELTGAMLVIPVGGRHFSEGWYNICYNKAAVSKGYEYVGYWKSLSEGGPGTEEWNAHLELVNEDEPDVDRVQSPTAEKVAGIRRREFRQHGDDGVTAGIILVWVMETGDPKKQKRMIGVDQKPEDQEDMTIGGQHERTTRNGSITKQPPPNSMKNRSAPRDGLRFGDAGGATSGRPLAGPPLAGVKLGGCRRPNAAQQGVGKLNRMGSPSVIDGTVPNWQDPYEHEGQESEDEETQYRRKSKRGRRGGSQRLREELGSIEEEVEGQFTDPNDDVDSDVERQHGGDDGPALGMNPTDGDPAAALLETIADNDDDDFQDDAEEKDTDEERDGTKSPIVDNDNDVSSRSDDDDDIPPGGSGAGNAGAGSRGRSPSNPDNEGSPQSKTAGRTRNSSGRKQEQGSQATQGASREDSKELSESERESATEFNNNSIPGFGSDNEIDDPELGKRKVMPSFRSFDYPHSLQPPPGTGSDKRSRKRKGGSSDNEPTAKRKKKSHSQGSNPTPERLGVFAKDGVPGGNVAQPGRGEKKNRLRKPRQDLLGFDFPHLKTTAKEKQL